MLPLFIIFTSSIFSNKYPSISVTSWSSSDAYTWDTTSAIPATFKNESTLVVPSTVGGIILTCNASFPIEWNIHHEQLQTKKNGRSRTMSLVSTMRKSDDIFDKNSFVYVSELTLMGDSTSLTGNYTCQSTEEEHEEFATNIYVYWEGTSPPFLIYAGDNRTVAYEKNQPLTIPCKVSRPDIPVTLFKQGDRLTDWAKVDGTEYEPSIGFIVAKPNPNNTYGQYKCVANDEPNKDVVLIHVVPKDQMPKPYEFHNYKKRGSSFEFIATNTTRGFKCCSNVDNKPPKLMHFYCDHPITCKLKKNALADIENNGKRSGDGRCTTFNLIIQISGIIRCQGEGIDVVKEYFFPMGFQYGFRLFLRKAVNITKPYYSWDEADPDKMLALSSQTSPMYVGRNVSINCQVSKYYFSRGARWMITWKNNSNSVIPEVIKNNTGRARSRYRQFFRRNIISLSIAADAEMLSVTCFAPVWNTSEWKSKTLNLSIEVPVPPTIDGEKTEIVEWYLNDTDKQLSCHSNGKPAPTYIRWKKDNQTVNLQKNITYVNGTSIFHVLRISYEHHGIYECSVTTFAGTATKTFQVLVHERTSSGLIVGIVISVLAVIGILIGVSILVLRLKAQKSTIKQMTNASFKDFENPNHQQIIPRENIYSNEPSHDEAPITIPALPIPIPNSHNTGFSNETGNYQKM